MPLLDPPINPGLVVAFKEHSLERGRIGAMPVEFFKAALKSMDGWMGLLQIHKFNKLNRITFQMSSSVSIPYRLLAVRGGIIDVAE